MNSLLSAIHFQRRLSDTEVADTADLVSDETRLTAAAPTPLRLFGFAALSGAVAGAVVTLAVAMFPLRSNEDPRTSQLVHDLGDVATQVRTLSDRTRTIETEDVATSQITGAIDHQLKTTTEELNAVQSALDGLNVEQQRRRDLMAGISAPALFGIATVQLRDRVEAGLPFDWELVNLRGIAGSDPALLPELDRLAPMAATGVVTQPRLIEAMQVLLSREASSSTLAQAGLGVVSRVFGSSLVSPPAGESQLLTLAMARLTATDLPNYLRVMQGLTGPTATAARPLVVAAQQRMIALAAVQKLLAAARTSLQAQLRAVSTVPAIQQRP